MRLTFYFAYYCAQTTLIFRDALILQGLCRYYNTPTFVHSLNDDQPALHTLPDVSIIHFFLLTIYIPNIFADNIKENSVCVWLATYIAPFVFLIILLVMQQIRFSL